MSYRAFLTTSTLALALLACNKEDEGLAAAPANDAIKITQAKPPPGGTWSDVVNETAAGGFVMGNPNAKVKLLEIASLTCPHCKKFEEEGVPALVEKYVKTGQVSWEFRPYLIHGPIDMAANLVARCNGARQFFPLVQSIYRDQETFLSRIETAPKEKLAQLEALPKEQMFGEIAGILGLQDWAAARGVQHAKSDKCLSDPNMIDQQVQISSDVTAQYPEFTGTPAFVIDGTMLPKGVRTWDKLEPALLEALK